MRLTNKTAIVTGAGRGIGEAIALAFAAQGANLVIASRTATELDDVAARARAFGIRATPLVADVASQEDVGHVVRETVRLHGGVDVLVNNAGVYGPIGPFVEADLDAWWKALEINLRGTLFFVHAVAPLLIAQRHGKIINFSGGGATSPLPNLTAYSVSKTAIVRLTENLAEELKPYNVQVNAISPGMVDTRLQDQLLHAGERAGADLHQRIKTMRETGKGGVPPTVAADLAVFLASDESASLTGKLISAPHDPWGQWAGHTDEIAASPLYTLRRLDAFTVRPLKDLV